MQLFIDAIGVINNETEVIINRFPINLDLELGENTAELETYTGAYNISRQGFDLSFRVQCSKYYYGKNCARVCEPMEGIYNCDSDGRVVCIQDGQDPNKSCMHTITGGERNQGELVTNQNNQQWHVYTKSSSEHCTDFTCRSTVALETFFSLSIILNAVLVIAVVLLTYYTLKLKQKVHTPVSTIIKGTCN